MTETTPTATVLLVDDESSILKSLQRLFRSKGMRTLSAGSGRDGLELLREQGDCVGLVISDQRMPEMSGSQFLEAAKSVAPGALRFLLTGYSDIESVVAAVNRGEIHRYLTKPWNDDELITASRQALGHFEVVRENRRLQQVTRGQNRQLLEMNRGLEDKVRERTAEIESKRRELSLLNSRLEDSFTEAVRLVSSLIDSVSPRLGQRMRLTAELACALARAEGFTDEHLQQMEAAALIHDVGLLGLSERWWDRVDLDPGVSENERFRDHPLVASALIAPVEKLQAAAEFVRHHHERMDGKGFPHGLQGETVPFGARILSAASDYCRLRFAGDRERMGGADSPQRAAALQKKAQRQILQGAGSRYDLRIIGSLLKVLDVWEREGRLADPDGGGPSVVELDQLTEGMVVSADLRLNDGRLLLARGSKLKAATIESLKRLRAYRLVESKIPVGVDPKAPAPMRQSSG
jgi:response regulator RpfG family c-di-GMP phosphodiesterase